MQEAGRLHTGDPYAQLQPLSCKQPHHHWFRRERLLILALNETKVELSPTVVLSPCHSPWPEC